MEESDEMLGGDDRFEFIQRIRVSGEIRGFRSETLRERRRLQLVYMNYKIIVQQNIYTARQKITSVSFFFLLTVKVCVFFSSHYTSARSDANVEGDSLLLKAFTNSAE